MTTKIKAQDLEDLDVKVESKFMKWLKRIAYVVTILTTLSGGVLGTISFIREVKDPRAQSGYEENSKMVKENSQNIRENREEIRFIYKTIIGMKNKEVEPPKVEDRVKKLPDTPIQRPLDWQKLPISKKAGD